MRTGEKSLQQAGRGQTDDRGIYRIYQLQPGDYIVCARTAEHEYRRPAASPSRPRSATLMQAAQTGGGAGGGGGGGSIITGLLNSGQVNGAGQQLLDRVGQLQQQLAEVEQQQNTAYAPVYYPGTTSETSATTLTLGVGEERASVDFRLELVPTAHVDGTVTSVGWRASTRHAGRTRANGPERDQRPGPWRRTWRASAPTASSCSRTSRLASTPSRREPRSESQDATTAHADPERPGRIRRPRRIRRRTGRPVRPGRGTDRASALGVGGRQHRRSGSAERRA